MEEFDRSGEPGLNAYHPYSCAFCGEENEVFVDAALLTNSPRATLTEDCAVCCRPNLITISMQHGDTLYVEAEQEYDA